MIEGFFPATAMPDPDWWQAPLAPARGGAGRDRPSARYGGYRPLLRRWPVHRGAGVHGPARHCDRHRSGDARFRSGESRCCWRRELHVIEGDAHDVAALVGRRVDFVLMANTFHGVPEKERLARAVAAILRPGGHFAVVNWHRRPREETTVLARPRGPATNLRMEPEDVEAAVKPAGLRYTGIVALPPYHYGAIFERPV